MFLEPNRTAYDLHFSVLGIPVRVHPLFWVVSFVLGFSAGDPKGILAWIVIVFVSILVHEMGHALTMRYYGYQPWVVLYGGGGLAIRSGGSSPWSPNSSFGRDRDHPITQIIISFAGPLAGFLLAGVVIAYMYAAGVYLDVAWMFTDNPDVSLQIGRGEVVSSPLLRVIIFDLLLVNTFWGLVNLLPVYPLDGGKISRELFTMFAPYDAVRQSLWLSLITSAAAALAGFTYFHSMLIGIMFALFAVMNWQMLNVSGGGGFGGGGGYGGGRPW